MAELHRRLGLTPGAYRLMIGYLERLGVDHRHLIIADEGRRKVGRARVTDQEFAAVVQASKTVSDVVRTLGGRPSGGMHRWATSRIRALGLDIDHFDRHAWLRTNPMGGARTRTPLAEVLVLGSRFASSDVRRRLIAAGLKEARCEGCGLDEWQGKPLPLELDHINGDHTNNRLENLRILCGNCHSQTETWCSGGRSPKAAPV